jgi:hypothetical protein
MSQLQQLPHLAAGNHAGLVNDQNLAAECRLDSLILYHPLDRDCVLETYLL